MRKLYVFMMVSVDGFFEGEDHDISWHNTDEEFNDFAIKQTGEAGTLLFGRVTYELMASYWPTASAKEDSQEVADLMNKTPKVVVSNTLQSVEWENTRLIKEHAIGEIAKLKEEDTPKDMAIFGSSDLTISLLEAELVDELRLMINPVILGKGKRLFEGFDKKLQLKLASSRAFRNGNVLMNYSVEYK